MEGISLLKYLGGLQGSGAFSPLCPTFEHLPIGVLFPKSELHSASGSVNDWTMLVRLQTKTFPSCNSPCTFSNSFTHRPKSHGLSCFVSPAQLQDPPSTVSVFLFRQWIAFGPSHACANHTFCPKRAHPQTYPGVERHVQLCATHVFW